MADPTTPQILSDQFLDAATATKENIDQLVKSLGDLYSGMSNTEEVWTSSLNAYYLRLG